MNPVSCAHVTSIVPQTPTAAAPQPNNIESLASLIKDINGIVNHTPSTPICGALSHDCAITLLNVPSPSQLTQFLSHADTNLGVRDASLYKSPLCHKCYGPDILHRVPDVALEELDIPPGNVIHLKDGAVAWWQNSNAKRKRSAFEPDGEAQGEPPAKHTVAYERRGVDAISLAHRW